MIPLQSRQEEQLILLMRQLPEQTRQKLLAAAAQLKEEHDSENMFGDPLPDWVTGGTHLKRPTDN